jgi:FkbM family methyltransferase
MIHIGDRFGKKYDYFTGYFRYYLPFVLKYNIKFRHWWKHGEILRNPTMYDRPTFIPSCGSMVLDIGAQYGDYALLWAKRNGARVYAIEALSSNYKEMFEDFALNMAVVIPIRAFVGNGLNVRYKNFGNMAEKTEEVNTEVEKTITIDDFVKEKDIRPDFIKIDVEGFEYEVLQGMIETLKKFKPKIIMETHSSELRRKCHKFLTDIGYEQWYEGRKTKGIRWMDEVVNLFYSR